MVFHIRLLAFLTVFISGYALATDQVEVKDVDLKEDARELTLEAGGFLTLNFFCEAYREYAQKLDVDLIYPYKSKAHNIVLSILEPPFVEIRKNGALKQIENFYPKYEEAFLKDFLKGRISNSAEEISEIVKTYKVQHPPKDCTMVPAYNKLLTMRINKLKDRHAELKKTDNR